MDIAITATTLRTRKLKTVGRWLLAILCIPLGLVLIQQLITPSLARSAIRTALVETGEISTEVLASGTVVPKYERVLTSPVNASVEEVYQQLGSSVSKGDPLLKVDSAPIALNIAKLDNELHLKELEITGLRQTQNQQMKNLQNEQELAALDLQSQQVLLARYATLYQSNIVSRFDYETTSLNTKKAEIKLQQLDRQITDSMASDSNRIEQIAIEKTLLQQQLAEQEQLLHDTTIRASADGIITVLASQLGQNVRTGDELARISDLSAFRIDASISDFYLGQISPGMAVNINLGTYTTTGQLSQILPSVDNGTIRLQIELADPGLEQLKPNLRVEVGIQTQYRSSGTRVTNGTAFNGAGLQQVFVLQNNVAVKRQVEVGLSNSRFVEILSGLEDGEEVIISSMENYRHLEQIAVK